MFKKLNYIHICNIEAVHLVILLSIRHMQVILIVGSPILGARPLLEAYLLHVWAVYVTSKLNRKNVQKIERVATFRFHRDHIDSTEGDNAFSSVKTSHRGSITPM